MNPRFYFATCQVGAEKAVKAEVLAEHPQLRFAFSRPGFITFKEDDGSRPAIANADSVFTRLWGVALTQTKDSEALGSLVSKELESHPEIKVIHPFERDTFVPGDEHKDFVMNAHAALLVQKLSAELGAPFTSKLTPRNLGEGDAVLDLIWVDDFHVFIGLHLHHELLDQAPGNQPLIERPEASPSRAYLKIEEAIHRFKPTVNKGAQVLEVGCSPGGASMAMLSKGLRVIGVDPKRMDQKLYLDQNFKFIQKMAKNVTKEDLASVNPEWIVMDMNIAPLEAMDELAHVVDLLKKSLGPNMKLKKGLLTIKLNDWKFAESIPLYLKRLYGMGFRGMIATQLCSNRQEFFVMADGFEF